LITGFLKEHALSYTHFDSLMEVDNSTSAIQGIKWSKPDREHPTVAIVSHLAIEDEVERKELYLSRIDGTPIMRSFYIIYDKKKKDSDRIAKVVNYLTTLQHATEQSN
jgi:hypothetical protein